MAKATNAPQRKRLDAPDTPKKFRAWVDENFGTDYVIVCYGTTQAYLENDHHGGKIELPAEFRPAFAQLALEHERQQAEQKAADLAQRRATDMYTTGASLEEIQAAGLPVDHLAMTHG